jgi:hypothetical protein
VDEVVTPEARASLGKAVAFLADLEADLASAPPEYLPLLQPYPARLREAIGRFRSGRELDAALFQIRLTYVRDLGRLLDDAPRVK